MIDTSIWRSIAVCTCCAKDLCLETPGGLFGQIMHAWPAPRSWDSRRSSYDSVGSSGCSSHHRRNGLIHQRGTTSSAEVQVILTSLPIAIFYLTSDDTGHANHDFVEFSARNILEILNKKRVLTVYVYSMNSAMTGTSPEYRSICL